MVSLWFVGCWGCGDDGSADLVRAVSSPDAGTDRDAGEPDHPDCGDDVELAGVGRLKPPAPWRAWAKRLQACLEELDIRPHRTFDGLSFWSADSIEVKLDAGDAARGALVCAHGAVVVDPGAGLERLLPSALVIAQVHEDDRAQASAACAERLTGPKCGTEAALDDLESLEPLPVWRTWYREMRTCLAELELTPRYDFDELSWWSTSSLEYGAVCSDGALVFPSTGASEHAVRQALALANADTRNEQKVTERCVDALVSPAQHD